jgi:putative DNA primase/helicase
MTVHNIKDLINPAAFKVVVDRALVHDRGVVTQDGVAQVFADRFADELRFCHTARSWYRWVDTHWAKDETATAFHFVRELGRELTDAATNPELKEVRRVTFAGGVERYCRSDPVFAVTAHHWDTDHFLLGTPGGTIDLRTGLLREARPKEAITKLTAVAPAEEANCPLWIKFLGETFGNDPDLIRFLKQWAGYNLTGDTREHALLFGTGKGGNGKGVWLNVHTNILRDYATTATMETFISSFADRHTTDVAMLNRARMVTASETEEGRAWAEARIKQMTGGDPITARFMRQDNFTFKPEFKLTIIGNHKPQLRNVDDAARRRFNIIPFDRQPKVPDRELEGKLMAEAPGILRWMIEGCLDWQKNGLVQPRSVIDATKSYFEDQDLMSQWLEEECEVAPGNSYKWEAVALLFEAWETYCTKAGEKAGTMKSFSNQLVSKGFSRIRTDKIRGLSGIRLRRRPSLHDER